jgi:hypothetical protein
MPCKKSKVSCKKSKVSYKNKVAFVQSETIFEDDTRVKYLKIKKSQFLTLNPANPNGNNEVKVFNFIKKHASENKIYNFVLHIDSGTLSNLIDYMAEKKENSRSVRNLLKKCTLVATYSNADYVRQQNMDKETGIYFSLSPLSVLLKSVPNGSVISTPNQQKEIMVVVSDTDSPYYQQIADSFNKADTTVDFKKMSELNKDKLNDFASKNGYLIITALDTVEEFRDFGKVVADSDYSKQVMFIELTQPDSQGLIDLQGQVSDIQAVSSGVCVNGTGYEELNNFIPYEKCAAALTIAWGCWEKFKEANVLSMNVDILNNEGEVTP